MSFNYTFTSTDLGKSFHLTATYKTFSDTITLHCNSQELDPGYDPVDESDISGSFPTGLSDEYFSIIYHTAPMSIADYADTLNLDELNEWARDYMEKVDPDSTEDYQTKTYYGKDSNGIYCVIPINAFNGNSHYKNPIYKFNEAGIPQSYKVYLAGTCDIVDIDGLPNNTELTLANGYYYDIDNTLYLFLNTRLNMVYFENDYTKFWYSGDEENKKSITSNSSYYQDRYYLKHNSQEKTNNLSEEPNARMINDGVINLIVTPNTVTDIEHFNSCSNVGTVILSDNLVNIGDYAFTASSISGTVQMNSANSKVQRIGKYAFGGCPNIKLFQVDGSEETVLPASIRTIDDNAFDGAPGLKSLNLSNCVNLEYVGNEAFARCNNLSQVTYLQSQVEPDNITNTRKIYLPPDKGTEGDWVPRVVSDPELVTAQFRYNYEDWINDAPEGSTEREKRIAERDAEDNNKAFLNAGPSAITWICK